MCSAAEHQYVLLGRFFSFSGSVRNEVEGLLEPLGFKIACDCCREMIIKSFLIDTWNPESPDDRTIAEAVERTPQHTAQNLLQFAPMILTCCI